MHDGVNRGKRYFQTQMNHGAFVHIGDILYVRSRGELAYRYGTMECEVCIAKYSQPP